MDKIVINFLTRQKVSWSVRKFCSKTAIRKVVGSIMKENEAILLAVILGVATLLKTNGIATFCFGKICLNGPLRMNLI